MKALVLYDTMGGNTEKVANRIHQTLANADGIEADLVKLDADTDVDLTAYDLLFMGSPVVAWLPTKKLMEFGSGQLDAYRKAGKLGPAAPTRPGKFAIAFCTYAGPHMGEREAVPATKWIGALLEHLGFRMLDEWHFVGEFHSKPEMNIKGRMGDIKGRPNENDLAAVAGRTQGIVAQLEAWLA